MDRRPTETAQDAAPVAIIIPMSRSHSRQLRREGYRWETSRPANCLVFVAPILIAFHVGSAYVRAPLLATADLERILGVFGHAAWYLPPVLIGVALLIQHSARRDRWRVRPAVLAGMVVESVLWALPLLAINYLVGRLLVTDGMLAAAGTTIQVNVLQALGAGVYEEFVFRYVFLGLIAWACTRNLDSPAKRDLITLVVLVASSLAFSLYHHFPWPGHVSAPAVNLPAFNLGDFTWRTVAGLCLGLVYAYRGFGIAVGAHVVWNLYWVFVACA